MSRIASLIVALILFLIVIASGVFVTSQPARSETVEMNVPCVDMELFMKTADLDKFKPFAIDLASPQSYQRIFMINPKGAILVADFFRDKKMVCVPVLVSDSEMDPNFNVKSFFQESN